MERQLVVVKVHPGSRREEVKQLGPTSFEVWTPVAADRGRANVEVAKLLAKHLGVAPSSIVLKRGATSRTKFFEIVS
ncbi:MAG: hypothetical protein KatS3mg130_0615 [Candidatus Sumerlaea sp.]|nr:MAG: hypothetical protein KatS3mg130_0615 [Candidatus Sumerlaea sp.]